MPVFLHHRHLHHRHLLLASGALLVALAACSPTEPGIPTLADLDRNRATWESQRPDRYSFDFSWTCFCSGSGLAPVRIEIQGDSVLSVERTAPAPDQAPEATGASGRTIDSLFDTLHALIELEPEHLRVIWHPRFGFPVEIVYDIRSYLADDNGSYRITRFRRLD